MRAHQVGRGLRRPGGGLTTGEAIRAGKEPRPPERPRPMVSSLWARPCWRGAGEKEGEGAFARG